ncbi:hypothetical protein Esti_002965 [Eimeria stiedai]
MGRKAPTWAPGRRVSKTQRKKETDNNIAGGPSKAAGSLSLLELQLQALVSSSTCAPPAAGLGGAEGVLADLVSFLKKFFSDIFRPVRLHLHKGQSEDAARPFHSERASSLFSRIPGNAPAREKEWLAPRPARVKVVGSCGAGFGPPSFARNLDLLFEIPEASLDKRDYLNYRYLAKRAAYVDAVHAQLKDAVASAVLAASWHWAKVCKGSCVRVELAVLPWRCDATKPYVSFRFLEAREMNSVTHAEDASARPSEHVLRQLQLWEIRMFPSCPVGFFKEKLLRSDANAVRRRTTATRGVIKSAHAAEAPVTEAEVKTLPPTPYYNALVLEDTRFAQHSKILQDCAEKVPGFRDAALLLKAWAKRRSLLASGPPPFSVCGFTVSFLLAHVCVANEDVARVATPAQLFRLALTFLAASDFKKYFYCFGQSAGLPKRALEEATIALLDAAVGSRNDAADAVAAAPSAIAVAAEVHQQEAQSRAQQQWGRRELCVGLVEEACLFDSAEKTFNVLWRAQLHIQAMLGFMLWSSQELQHEARSSLKALQSLEDPFLLLFGDHQEQLFLKSDLWVQVPWLPPRGDAYDLEAAVPAANYEAPTLNRRHAGQGIFDEDQLDDAPKHLDPPKWEASPAFLGASALGRLLVRGLSDRLQILRFRFTPAELVGPSAANGGVADRCPVGVLLCASLNGKASSRLLDRGPPVVDASEAASRSPKAVAADSFRQCCRRFWGSRCDIRRFQDGRMLHCVLWEKFTVVEGPAALDRTSSSDGDSQSPPEQIVRSVLERHAADLCSQTFFLSKAEHSPENPKRGPGKRVKKHPTEVFCSPLGAIGPLSERQKALLRAFAALKNLLCSLSSVPLAIKQIWHSDAALRHTEVVSANTWEPEAAEGTTVHSVIVQFEDSGKWPVEREAVRKLKTAFLVAMNEELLRDYSISSNVMESYLDTHFQSFIFRVQIFHPNEVMEEANIFTDFSLKPIISRLGKALHANKFNREDAAPAGSCSMSSEKAALQTCEMLLQEDVAFLTSTSPFKGDTMAHLRSLWWGPQVAAMLHSLALRHTAFAGAVRLATLWLSKQLVVGAVHFAEHVMAFLFVDYLRAGYGEEPQSPHVALLRFLLFVGSFDWEQSPLLISFDSAARLTDDQRHQMHVSFEHFGHLPSVHSAIDPHGFILPRPEPASFQRLLRCARSCSQKIKSAGAGLRLSPLLWRGLFCTDWRQFDIIVRFKDPLASPATRSAEPTPKKKRRFANLAFNSQTERKNASLLIGLLQQEGATDITLQLAAKGIHLSSTAPEAAAVLDDLLLRALGSRACVRRYLFLRFLQRLCRAFPDAVVVGFNFVQAQQLAGGLPDSVALKIPPGLLLCKPLQPSSASPRLLFCPSWETRRETFESVNMKSTEEGILATEQGAPMAVLSPPMLLGGIMSSGAGLLQDVLLT